MFINDWKRDILTIPNFLSLFRLLLIPVYISIYLNADMPRDYLFSASILALSCLTDFLDGQIARHFGLVTDLGKVLDPLADKLTQLTLCVCLSVHYPALRGVLILLVIKECFQTGTAYLMFRNGKVLDGSLPAGKISTAILFVSFIILMLFPALSLKAVTTIAVIDACFLSNAFIRYFQAFFGRNQKLQDLQE